MENENCNIENEQVATIQPGKNIFKFDGPIGRATFLKTVGIQLLIATAAMLIYYIITISFSDNLLDIFSKTLNIGYSMLMIYITGINYSKRIYDIICDPQKAIFYSVAIILALFALCAIPSIQKVGVLFGFILLLFLSIKKGELVK